MELQKMIVDQESAKKCGFGPFPVTIVPHFPVKLSDGIHLSIKLWFPSSDLENTNLKDSKNYPVFRPKEVQQPTKFPVILEYLPYQKTDYTSPSDFERHTWFCSHGYVAVRADMRGSGDSEGLYHDEFRPQEQQDCVELIDWLANQEWCNGRVGMFGISWGGFSGLQAAYEQADALKSVVSLCSTDNRYKTEMYRHGGCVIGNGLFPWSSIMLLLNARPPSPDFINDWKRKWRERLEILKPWANIWLRHQHWDEYLQHGSICQDYSKVKCPVLAIGGWKDGYHDAVFRLAQNLPSCKAIIGPWAHNWPYCVIPGPNFAFLEECIEWFNCHLKFEHNKVMGLPLLRIYSMDTAAPASTNLPGKWLEPDECPSQSQTKAVILTPNNENMNLCTGRVSDLCIREVRFDGYVGLNTGLWLCFGRKEEFPLDQTENNALSHTWTTKDLTEPLTIMGFPEFGCWLSLSGGKVANMVVRLCDIRPDGTSTLITWGCVNLNRGKNHTLEESNFLETGKWMYVRVELNSTAYTVPVGHQLSLSVSHSFWPLVWPAPHATTFHIRTGGTNENSTRLKLPIITKEKLLTETNGKYILQQPTPWVKLPVSWLQEPKYNRNIEKSDDERRAIVIIEDNAGRRILHDTNTILAEEANEKYEIDRHNPTSAKVEIKRSYDTEWPHHNTKVHIEVECEMKADELNFYTDHKLVVKLNGAVFFERDWQDTITRDFI